ATTWAGPRDPARHRPLRSTWTDRAGWSRASSNLGAVGEAVALRGTQTNRTELHSARFFFRLDCLAGGGQHNLVLCAILFVFCFAPPPHPLSPAQPRARRCPFLRGTRGGGRNAVD